MFLEVVFGSFIAFGALTYASTAINHVFHGPKGKDDKVECKKETVIVTFKGNSYDVSDFVMHHPGGKGVLLKNNGKDVEQLMLANQHSEHAYEELAKYIIKCN